MCSGEHSTAEECIEALRGVIAEMEMRQDGGAGGFIPPGGRRDRKDHRFVFLDGERLCVADAARKLGLAPGALHQRLIQRTGNPDFRDVDVRAVGADKARAAGRRPKTQNTEEETCCA